MAEGQAAKEEQVAQLKVEILALQRDYKWLGNPYMSREQLLTFDMLERHPLFTDQVEYEFQWDQVDALYEFIDRLPAWVVDDEIMEVWRSGSEDAPQSFWGWEAKKAEWGQVLMLSWSPAWFSGRPASPVAKVFTAVVVCIHPCQVVMSVKDATNDLLNHSVTMPTRSMSTLCRLPRCSGTFYPSPLNHSFLVLPYLGIRGGVKEVRLDLPVVLNKHMVVRHLHRCQTPGGDEVVLPPIYSKDLGIPGTLEVGYLGPLWKNSQYTTAVPARGTGLQGVQLAISKVTFCPDKKNARRSLAPMQGEGIVYSPKWYDRSRKPRENPNAVQPNNPSNHDSEPGGDPSVLENEPDNTAMSVPPVPDDMVGDGSDKDDATSREASGAGSDSGSGSSGSGSSSGSEDSSQDSASSGSGSGKGDANSNAQGDAPRCKVRQKKKLHQSSNAESDEESVPKVTTGKTGGNPDGEAKTTSQDLGLGDSTTVHSITLPSMATLEALTDDLEKLGRELF